MPKLTGFADDDLHSNINEALKVLSKAQDVYEHALRGIEAQYLKALDVAFQPQAAAVRRLYATLPNQPDAAADAVRARFD